MASNADLTAIIDGDVQGLKDAMREATGAVKEAETGIGASVKALEKSMAGSFEAITGTIQSFKTLVGTAAPVALFNLLGAETDKAITSFRKIGDDADKLALRTDFFQGLKYAAEQAHVDFAKVNEGLKEFVKNVAEMKDDSDNKLAKKVSEENAALVAQLKAAKDVETAIRAVSQTMHAMDSDVDRSTLAMKLFGKEHGDVARVLNEGSDSLTRAAEESKKYGLTVDDSLIRRAQEIKTGFTSLSQVIDIQFKAALLDLAPVIKDASGLLGGLSHAVAQVHDALASPENKSDEGLRKWIEGIKGQISDTEKMIATMKSNDANSWFSGASDWQIANQEKYLETKRQELDLYQKILATRNADSWERGTKLTERAFTTDDDDKKPKTEEALRALSQLQKTYYAESKQTMQLIWQQDEEELRRFEKMLNDKKISQEEFEKARILIMNTTAVRVKNLLDEETKQIKAISGLIEKDLESAFSQFVNKGKVNWQQLAHTMLADLASLEFKMLVMQPLFGGKAQAGGGFGASSTSSQGLIGGALQGFSPFGALAKLFHEGGVVGVDGVNRMVSSAVFAGAARYHEGGIAGLAPDEVPAILQQGETVIPKGGSAAGHSFNFTIDARGAEIGVETKINQALARATPQIVKHAVAAVEATANKRPGYLSK